MTFPILSALIFLPLLGAGLMLLIRHPQAEQAAVNAKRGALLISAVLFMLASWLLLKFEPIAGFQFTEDLAWIPALGARYTLGVDGISILFVWLTALLTPLCLLVSWESIKDRVQTFCACLLAMQGLVTGVFVTLDMVLFYVFWEAMLIPMFLLIGIWGGKERVYAALKFFLYTFVGSVLMLVALFYLYHVSGGLFDVRDLIGVELTLTEQKWLFWAFFAAFAVKVPMWPVHTWLPAAHVQAPTAGSVLLAGILLKMGAYGFLRFSLPLFPEASVHYAPIIFALSVIAILYTALVAFAQTDIKKLIAYSSVSHMGFVTLGIFALTPQSMTGAVLQMVNHGVVAAALFMLIGVIYDRMHTRELSQFGGIVHRLPVYAAIMMVFTMAAVGLPGTNSFIGEFLILLGSFPTARTATILAAFGVVLGALYMLWLYRQMIFGEITNKAISKLPPLTPREIGMFIPLLLLVFAIGLFPQSWLAVIEPSVMTIIEQVDPAPAEVLIGEMNLTTEVKEHH